MTLQVITGPGKYVRYDGVVENIEECSSCYPWIGSVFFYYSNGTFFSDDVKDLDSLIEECDWKGYFISHKLGTVVNSLKYYCLEE
jgi:hypothetical protein